MALELKNGEIFLHVPKTGGSWITKALIELDLVKNIAGLQHWDVTRILYRERLMDGRNVIRHFANRRLSTTYKAKSEAHPIMFSFVRNPFHWLQSEWRFWMGRPTEKWGVESRASRDPQLWWTPGGPLDPLFSTSFPEFVTNILKNRPGFVTELYGLYDQWPVSYVGKQETLVEDLARFLQLRGYNVTEDQLRAIPKENESSPSVPKPEWPEALRIQVALTEFPAFIRYGYYDALPDAVKNLHPAVQALDYGGAPTIAEYTGGYPT